MRIDIGDGRQVLLSQDKKLGWLLLQTPDGGYAVDSELTSEQLAEVLESTE
jgi:hypothetical protein